MASRTIASVLLPLVCACATARIDPALYDEKTFVLASVHARRDISFDAGGMMFPYDDNELGAEVVEMTLADTEVELADVLGVDALVPLSKALKERAYDDLPEALPPEAWSQVGNQTAVDLDSPKARPALGALARAMHVDAAVVLRHEWSLARDRTEMTDVVTAYDRCTLLVVDANGRPLWDDVVVAREPVTVLFTGELGPGLNGASWGDEARATARRTARGCLDQFKRHRAEQRPKRPSTSTPPPPLEPAPPAPRG